MTLYPFQEQAVEWACGLANPSFLFAFSCGLGKTRATIEYLKRNNIERITIICPAVVRGGWFREFRTVWPERQGDIGLIAVGRKVSLSKPKTRERDRAYRAPIKIVSYALLSELVRTQTDAIVFDEIHYLKTGTSRAAKMAKGLTNRNPKAHKIGLSATLMPDRVSDIWFPLYMFFGDEWGKPIRSGKYSYEFNRRYMNFEQTEWGPRFYGINEAHRGELSERLSEVSFRVTKSEVADQLPPFTIRSLEIEPKRKKDYTYQQVTEDEIKRQVIRAGEEKLEHVAPWVEETFLDPDITHATIFTYTKKTALAVYHLLRYAGNLSTFCITGANQPSQRNDIIKDFKESERAVLVATMDACGIGVNGLDISQAALFAELHYRPEKLTQAVGRFNRLSSTESCSVDLLVMVGTLDEVVALKVSEKMEAINSVIEPDAAEEQIQEELLGTDDAWLDRLSEAAKGLRDE